MLWTAFVLGFAGSLHCLGMCSPLAMAVTNRSSKVLAGRMVYNLGRVFTYGVVGSLVASVGVGFPALIKYQNLISILLGISLLVIGFAGISVIKVPGVTDVLGRFSIFLKELFSRFLQRKGQMSMFLLGSLNGVLPCGLSFLALTYCLTVGGPVDGFLFMGAFGLGTLPVMFGLTGLFHWMIESFRLPVKSITTGMLILSGLLLIGRVFFVHLPHLNDFRQDAIDIVICR